MWIDKTGKIVRMTPGELPVPILRERMHNSLGLSAGTISAGQGVWAVPAKRFHARAPQPAQRSDTRILPKDKLLLRAMREKAEIQGVQERA